MQCTSRVRANGRLSPRQAMTLLELSVVIMVMLALMSILFIGAKSWMRGSDRAGCVMNIRNVQLAVRSYQNVAGYDLGQNLRSSSGGGDILEVINTEGYLQPKLYQIAKGEHVCPGNGNCTCSSRNTFPLIGDLFMDCSLASERNHVPDRHSDW